MLQREFNYHALMVKEDNGGYRLATGDEILEAALSEINRRFARGVTISAPAETLEFLRLRLGPLEHEVFAVLWLDNKHRVLAFEEMFRGTINSASVHPREIVKSALRYNAAACILCHNHPSGVADPSSADQKITEQVREAFRQGEVGVGDGFRPKCKNERANPRCRHHMVGSTSGSGTAQSGYGDRSRGCGTGPGMAVRGRSLSGAGRAWFDWLFAMTDSTVFLAMQRVESEQPPGETEFVNELLCRRNFMGLIDRADQHMPQDQRPVPWSGRRVSNPSYDLKRS